jgi:hypothetical protein
MSADSTSNRRTDRERIVAGLLDAAWNRVRLGPLERHRSRGPFDPGTVAGALGLAPGDLLACERSAVENGPFDDDASVEELLGSRLALAGADAAATLIALAVELAWAIDERRFTSREGLEPLVQEAIDRNLAALGLDEPRPYSYEPAAESVGRITDAAVNHGVASFGPIVILATAVDAIAAVIARTAANLRDWEADEQDQPVDVRDNALY